MKVERRVSFEVDTATGPTTRLISVMAVTGGPDGPVTREFLRTERLPG